MGPSCSIVLFKTAMNVLRMVKLFGWETKMNVRITEKRNTEIEWIRKQQILNLISHNLKWVLSPCNFFRLLKSDLYSLVIPVVTMIATFATYVSHKRSRWLPIEIEKPVPDPHYETGVGGLKSLFLYVWCVMELLHFCESLMRNSSIWLAQGSNAYGILDDAATCTKLAKFSRGISRKHLIIIPQARCRWTV